MTTDIFIRTFAGDLEWLPYCLASIRKYCHGFANVLVACPKSEGPIVFPAVHRFHCLPIETEGQQPGYLCQQATKMEADKWCKSDFILYVDSDCVFHTDNSPESYFLNGRPILPVTPYEHVGDAQCWKPLTEKILGFECPLETMRRHPSIWHRDTIAGTRRHIEQRTGRTIRQAVMESGGFSEFNALGSWVIKNEPDRYQIWNTVCNAPLAPLLRQFWSRGGILPEHRKWIEGVLS